MSKEAGKLATWRLQLSEFDFEVIHQAGFKHQAEDALLSLCTIGMNEYPFQDDLPALMMIIEVQSEVGNNKSCTEIWHNVPCNDACTT